MGGAVEKVRGAGGGEVAVTERGTFFGYGDLVVDMRNFERLRATTGAPVIFDATHAVQRPGHGALGTSGGDRGHVPALLAAAAVAGADGFSLETHPDPARALSDAATQWPLDHLAELLDRTLDLWARARDLVIPSPAREG
jgi:2-dehydro-3-deoxyphosphooctonate aldolase (KDO 8-P synthase)